jgi:pyrroline-5-carboxylate reductase
VDLCFFGGGNMANALIGGLMQGKVPLRRLHVIEPQATVRESLTKKFSAAAQSRATQWTVDVQGPADLADWRSEDLWLIMAVKPQHMREACQDAPAELKSHLRDASILSIAAGISIHALGTWCGNTRIVRAMPNTPALVGQGVTGLFAHADVTAEKRAQAEQLMQAVGQTVWVGDESLMDAVTALSGSGPAYVFLFIEALSQAGARLGLNAEQSTLLARATLEGALALLNASEETPAQLREKVTSKGGTTAAALAHLDQAGFTQIIEAAVKAARDRGAELSAQYR